MDKLLTKSILILTCFLLALSLVSCATATVDDTVEEIPETISVPIEEPEGKTLGRVYFAAPLFSQSEKEYNLRITNILEEYGYEVFLPQRDGVEAALLEGKSQQELIEIIFEKDVSEIMKSDILFFMLDGRVPDEGACVELGIAYSNGKRCYGFMTDTRTVELGLELNPMISGCFIRLFKNYDGEILIEELRQYLSENEL